MNRPEKSFLFFAMLSVFCICADYAILRPTSNALFLTLFSSQAYPLVWLATVPLNLFVVYLYNRFLPKIGPLRMLCLFAILTLSINALAGLLYASYPYFLFFQYAWKDIYVLFMLKQIWSLIHSTILPARGKSLYGFIYGMGTLGAILGSLVPSFLALHLGSEQILYLTAPIYILLIFAYTMAFRRSAIQTATFPSDLTANPRPAEALSLIRRSPALIAILLLVIFMQISVGLMEYRFNAHLEITILEKDLRTAYCGRLVGLVNLVSLFLQFLGGFILTRFLGQRGSHFLIPFLLCLSTLSSLAWPSFAMISFSYLFLKAVDFSLFGILREGLYAPLPLDAKFRAKALIDVFAYRTSKGLLSLGLIALQFLAGAALLPLVSTLSLLVFLGWLLTVAFLFRKRPVPEF